MVIYFSGTGNSRHCAKIIADRLNDTLYNSGDDIKNNKTADIFSDSPLVFVCPTYAWRIPHIFADFIKQSSFTGCRDAYFIMTCGDDIGNAKKYIKQLCNKKNFNLKGVLGIVMPENYFPMFDVPDEKASREIILNAESKIKAAADLIKAQKPFEDGSIKLSDNIKSGITNILFYKLCVKAKPFHATEKCISCQKCAELCPLNNITLINGKPVWGNNCTHCLSCICYCPVEAIEYGKVSSKRRRYRCEDHI